MILFLLTLHVSTTLIHFPYQPHHVQGNGSFGTVLADTD